MKRATLTATIGRQVKPLYSGDPSHPDHVAYLQAAAIRCVNECAASGAARPTFNYTVAIIPEEKPSVNEVATAIPTMEIER